MRWRLVHVTLALAISFATLALPLRAAAQQVDPSALETPQGPVETEIIDGDLLRAFWCGLIDGLGSGSLPGLLGWLSPCRTRMIVIEAGPTYA